VVRKVFLAVVLALTALAAGAAMMTERSGGGRINAAARDLP